MQKRVFKDIQIKKKAPAVVQKPSANTNFAERNQANIPVYKEKPVFDTINKPKPAPSYQAKESFVIGGEAIIKEKAPVYTKKENTEPVTNTDFSTFEDQIYSYKPKKTINRKTRIFSTLFAIFFVGFVILIYSVTRTSLLITPKIVDVNVNESININSWVKPLKSTVMTIEETEDLAQNEDETKKTLDQKIKDRLKYDMPMGYILVSGCKTSTYYETITKENDTKKIKAKITALVIEESSLKKYLTENLKLKDKEIKEIFNLNCELKTDISKYSSGVLANNLSILIGGKIKSEYTIDKEEITKNVLGKSKTTAKNYLSNREGILEYTIKSRPLGFIHVIPKNPNHFNIKIESAFN